MADDEGDKGYTWETEYERTWEAIQEDEGGSLQASVEDIVHRAKRKKLAERPINVKLGMVDVTLKARRLASYRLYDTESLRTSRMETQAQFTRVRCTTTDRLARFWMRHLFIVIDMSRAMDDQDLKPTRLRCTLKVLEHFVEELFDQNPIAQLGIITTRGKRAEKLTELGGNPRRHIEALRGQKIAECKGEPSLENSLDLALQTLKHVPGHASREILVIFGSLTTCDPGNIMDTIKSLRSCNIRCSVIGLAAEVHVCKKLCQTLKGKYDVILEETHFRDLLLQHVMPPPATVQTEASLIRMGFPHHQLKGEGDKEDKPSMCLCHLESNNKKGFSNQGYFCPQCKAKYCELPMECKACGLMLVSAPHLARSYHHLFPLDSFLELQTAELSPKSTCFSCQKVLNDSTVARAMFFPLCPLSDEGNKFPRNMDHPSTVPKVYQCRKCRKVFCIDCDIFVHETLHSCPGCATSRAMQQMEASFVS